MNPLMIWMAYAVPLAFALLLHLHARRRRELASVAVMRQSVETGMTEPPSLHPVVNPALCCGAGACVNACPEQALGIVNGKAQLVNPTVCIGHGACAAACPMEAIKLVFGTETRGIDIPYVKPTFETNVPGIYIAGELGGMGLVRKAAEQGKQAIESVVKGGRGSSDLDVVIVGAGPAGLSATLGAMEKKLRFVTLEQEDSLGGTVYHYPRNKIVMTQPVVLPLAGKAKLGEISKESLLAFWQDIVERFGMKIEFGQRVEKVTAVDNGFIVKTDRAEYSTRAVLLAIGRRGTPRKLEVPGEELPKVVYRLIDPEQYRNQHVLVVGGGDSAIEAAVAIAAEEGTTVTLSYRGAAFGRIKQKNRERLAAAEQEGRLKVVLGSKVSRIEAECVYLECGESVKLANDAVIVCAGGILPTPMLKEMGIRVETKFGTE
ncbi:NAD(P)-binding domain-containing protein [Sulfuritalea hydrogenivorans]|jgi:thioredoxin reductase/NAD-dependent dihydropyrimidine dehydrogenase PreA subunit|uniref:FAD-dependent pyridine nucleotide-disulfide oxidoreductase n=1 Tax=Sulfuritalea hydrogenivorans sk43H TaxID=1223802 RepID=W0SEA7_9PROT|nr:NAD(P)-binding domain-containing protein [Sulfuritalea hydrogenivorans]BAO29267.1 FAD-dependent pyridine nucleotide-disulfide oxidoreductase [Sulfuritalea hydrogenivorans sk43H]